MAVEQKPGAKAVVEAKTEVVAGLSRDGDVVAEPWLKPKNNGSLIPARRKLVKKMMFDCIKRFIDSKFCAKGSPTSSGAAVIHGHGESGQMMLPPPNPKAEKNVSKILPHP